MALSEQSRYTEGQFQWISTKSRGNKYTVYLNTVTWMTAAYTVYIIREGDTMAMVATKFYQDPGRWWVIADANPQVFQPHVQLTPGTMLRVPT